MQSITFNANGRLIDNIMWFDNCFFLFFFNFELFSPYNYSIIKKIKNTSYSRRL